MIAEFMGAFFHKVAQGYHTNGISSGADHSSKGLYITELDGSAEYCIALRKNI